MKWRRKPRTVLNGEEIMKAMKLAARDGSSVMEVRHDECIIIISHAIRAIYHGLPWYARLWWQIRSWLTRTFKRF